MRRKKIKFNKEIAIGITTFLRNSSLYKLLESIVEYLPDIKIYIVDQDDKPTKFKSTLYDGLIANGHEINFIEYDCGISKARNILRNLVKEPFLCFMQDDFIVIPETNLNNMLDVLKTNPNVGVVGAKLTGAPITGSYSYYFLKMGDSLLYLPVAYCLEKGIIQWQKTSNQVSYLSADIVSEFTIWRKEIPELFDDNVKTLEHTHSYLKLKYKTDWKVAYTPDSEILHIHDKNETKYNQFRKRTNDIDYIKEYWNLKEFIKFDNKKYDFLLEKRNWSVISPNIKKSEEITKDIKVQTKELKKEEKKILNEDNSFGSFSNTELYNVLDEFITIISKFDKPYYLAGDTCLGACVNHILRGSNLYLTIPKLDNTEIQYLANKGFNYNEDNNSFTKNDYNIIIDHKIPKNSKLVNVKDNNNKNYQVPLPAVGYLRKIYGIHWKKAGEELLKG